MFRELERVRLAVDLPEEGLKAGHAGTVVCVHEEGAGYTVEFLSRGGKDSTVVTLLADKVAALPEETSR